MEINGIEDMRYSDSRVDIVIGIELDENTANRWEIEDPTVLVVYRTGKNTLLDYIKLIDKGMIVHGYEFSQEEEEKILDFLKKENIEEKIKNM